MKNFMKVIFLAAGTIFTAIATIIYPPLFFPGVAATFLVLDC